MKNSILHVMKAFSACAVLGVSSLAAQSHNLVANVPFDFTVDEPTLRGRYVHRNKRKFSRPDPDPRQGKTARQCSC